MAHNHGSEYQVKIVHKDGTEELSGWMNNGAQVAQAMAAIQGPQGNAYWLRERNVVCLNCGQPGISASPYLALIDLIQNLPTADQARDVLMITSGIDLDYGPGPSNP